LAHLANLFTTNLLEKSTHDLLLNTQRASLSEIFFHASTKKVGAMNLTAN